MRSTTRDSSAFSSVRCCDGLELVVDDEHLGLRLRVGLLELLELPFADERARVGARAVLDDLRDRVDARGARELLELGDLVVRVGAGREHCEDEPALGLGRPTSDRAVSPSSGRHYDACRAVLPTSPPARSSLSISPPRAVHEREAMELVRSLLPGPALYDDGEAIVWGDPAAPIALAGHLDTVPAQGNIPGRIDGGAVHGLGASDMKGGVAVMLELARAGLAARYVFFTREEVPLEESPLPGVFESGVLGGVELAVVLEPTDCILHAGCLGNLQARVDFHGESAHSARPWTGAERDPRARRRARPGRGARAARRRARRVGLPRGAQRRARRGRDRAERRAGDRVGGAQLPLRAGPVARRGGGAPARARSCGGAPRPPQLAGRAARAREPARRAAARARPGRRAEAGVDAGRAVRRAGHRRDQLRPGRDGVRAQGRRADPDREPRAPLRALRARGPPALR